EPRSRGLSWQRLAREISAPFGRVPSRPISPSTLSGLRSHRAIEGDGVLQMLRWLHRAPESFVPGQACAHPEVAMLPDVGSTRILRFDTRKIYAMLDAQRAGRALTWTQVAREIGGGSPPRLTRSAHRGRTPLPPGARVAGWLPVPVAGLPPGLARWCL